MTNEVGCSLGPNGPGTLFLTGAEMQLGRGETIADTAKVLSRYVDGVMIRVLEHETVLELAENATIPVINGLTHRSHPCQVMADVMTFEEHRGPITGKRIAWVGDANNVQASWMQAVARELNLSETAFLVAGEDGFGLRWFTPAGRSGQRVPRLRPVPPRPGRRSRPVGAAGGRASRRPHRGDPRLPRHRGIRAVRLPRSPRLSAPAV